MVRLVGRVAHDVEELGEGQHGGLLRNDEADPEVGLDQGRLGLRGRRRDSRSFAVWCTPVAPLAMPPPPALGAALPRDSPMQPKFRRSREPPAMGRSRAVTLPTGRHAWTMPHVASARIHEVHEQRDDGAAVITRNLAHFPIHLGPQTARRLRVGTDLPLRRIAHDQTTLNVWTAPVFRTGKCLRRAGT